MRVEIQLDSLRNRFSSILDSPIGQDEKVKMISKLYAQQYKLLRYLLAEIITSDPPQPKIKYQEEENAHLQVEILDHIQSVIAQFWKEPHLSRIKEQYNDNILHLYRPYY